MKSLELKWGLIIGAANLVWLYLSYYLGIRTAGLTSVQWMSGIWLFVTLVGFVLAFREFGRMDAGYTFTEGVKMGGLIAVVTSLIAFVAYFGYFKIVHPGFTDYMVDEWGKWAERRDMSPEQVDEIVKAAERNFGFKRYLVQSAVGALFFGCIFSIIISTVHHLRNRR